MSWKKYFKPANLSPISGSNSNNTAVSNYDSWLPQVYEGPLYYFQTNKLCEFKNTGKIVYP